MVKVPGSALPPCCSVGFAVEQLSGWSLSMSWDHTSSPVRAEIRTPVPGGQDNSLIPCLQLLYVCQRPTCTRMRVRTLVCHCTDLMCFRTRKSEASRNQPYLRHRSGFSPNWSRPKLRLVRALSLPPSTIQAIPGPFRHRGLAP